MKRPAWFTISSIAGLVLFCCGLSGLFSTSVIEISIPTSLPTLLSTSLPPPAPLLPNPMDTRVISVTALPATSSDTLIPPSEFTSTLLPTNTVFSSPTDTALPTANSSPTATTRPTATPSPIHGFVMVEYSKSAYVGGGAYATIQTVPGVSCSIKYYTPASTLSVAQGLEPQTADKDGICSWSWNIGSRTKPGTGRIIITANGTTQQFPIEITKA